MSLSTRIMKSMVAGFSGIWIRSFEHQDATRVIGAAFHKQGSASNASPRGGLVKPKLMRAPREK